MNKSDIIMSMNFDKTNFFFLSLTPEYAEKLVKEMT